MKYKRINKADRRKKYLSEINRKVLNKKQQELLEKNQTKERRREVMRKMGMLSKEIEKLLDY